MDKLSEPSAAADGLGLSIETSHRFELVTFNRPLPQTVLTNWNGKLFRENLQFRKISARCGREDLFDGVKTISLSPKVFDTLLLLVENGGRVLSKERMLKEIWEDSFVEENNLAQNISTLRRVLGETKEVKFIETVPKFGYRFVAPVTQVGRRRGNLSSERGREFLIREVSEEVEESEE